MSDSTSKLTQLTSAQAGKEETVNELFNAISQAALFGRSQASSGLNFVLFGGRVQIDGVATDISNVTVALTASQTNYVEATRAGSVSANTTSFTAGRIPLYKVVAGASTVTSYEDHRPWITLAPNVLSRSFASDANITLTQSEASADIMEFTSAVSLTATRDVVLPLAPKIYLVYNNTTGGQDLRFIGATGTGIDVPPGSRQQIYADGTNIVELAVSNETVNSLGSLIAGAASKTTPVNADSLGIVDSADSNVLKKLTFANLWAWVKGKIESVALSALSVGNLTVTGTGGNTFYSSWTPTATAGTNVSAVTVYAQSYYFRIGNYVVFSFPVDVTFSAAGDSYILISIPVASDFSSARYASGVVNGIKTTAIGASPGQIYADPTNDALYIRMWAAESGVSVTRCVGAYLIL